MQWPSGRVIHRGWPQTGLPKVGPVGATPAAGLAAAAGIALQKEVWRQAALHTPEFSNQWQHGRVSTLALLLLMKNQNCISLPSELFGTGKTIWQGRLFFAVFVWVFTYPPAHKATLRNLTSIPAGVGLHPDLWACSFLALPSFFHIGELAHKRLLINSLDPWVSWAALFG